MDSQYPGITKINSREQFKKYLLNPEEFTNLCDSCVSGDTEGFGCRWTAWRAFLGLLPVGDERQMREEVKKQRKYYSQEFDKYMNFRSKVQLSADVDNPLSTASSNPWNSFYTDNEIKEEIAKDIERTYQDMEFFLLKPIQTLLTNILFIWSKQNSDLSYRQGMNEIVAVFTYVCFTENYKAQNEEDIYDFLNNEQYAEADIYTVFKKVMELDQKNMFVYQQPASNKPGKKKKPEPGDPAARPNLPFVHRAVYIQEELLPQLHPYISNHFKSLFIEPNIYMMRWLRCMLAREFKVNQVLILWDAIFGYHYKYTPTSKKLLMLDYLCIMMILNISDDLLSIDNNGMILGKLLKYPPTEDVGSFITICNTHVLNGLHAGGALDPKEPQNTGFEVLDSPNPSDKGQDEDRPPAPVVHPDKKIVLFNPNMSIFKPKKGINARKLENEPSDANDPLSAPMIKKKPAETKPANLFSPNVPPINKPQPSSISPDKKDEGDNAKDQIKVKAFSDRLGNDNDILSQPKKPENIKASPVLFGADKEKGNYPFGKDTKEDPKPSPAGLFQVNKNTSSTNPFGREPKTQDLLPSAASNTQKDAAECIKKLQNAIKLINLENDKNGSLVLEEALTDLSSVMKIIKEKFAK